MNILITGGAGYVGFSLVQSLLPSLDSDATIVVYDNLSRSSYNFFFQGQKDQRIRFVRGELLDSRLLQKQVEQADVIYHLAARVTTPFADHDSHAFEQVNHWGTAQLVQLVEKYGASQFIYLSSISVYGRTTEPVDETMPIYPESFYGFSKARAEDHVQRLQQAGIKTYIIRAGNVYGYNPCLRFDAVINKFIFQAHTEGRLHIHGSGQQHRAFIHVEKLAIILRQLIEKSIPPGIYNAAEHNLSINTIADTLKALYPSLERLYINQHLNMREIQIKTPSAISAHIPLPDRSFEDELRHFKTAFAF